MLTRPFKLASLLVLVNGSLLFLAGICVFGQTAVRVQGTGASGAVARECGSIAGG